MPDRLRLLARALVPSRLIRPTIRLRLTLLYGLLFLLSGAGLLALAFLLHTVVAVSANHYGPFGNPAGPDITFTPAQLRALVDKVLAAERVGLLQVFGIALAAMAVASVAIGWFVAGRVLRPMRAMSASVREISMINLQRRVRTPGPDDELQELGTTFNDLLDRLEHSFDAQRQFVANASHELRTPLTRQRAMIQVALRDPDATWESLRATLERVLAAGRQQEGLIEALLELARGERGLERRDQVDLAAAIDDVLVSRSSAIQQRSLRLKAELHPSAVLGDPRLLEGLVANLVDNALRYNVAEGEVDVQVMPRDGSVVLRVVNSGPLVPASEIERLFEPFQRLRTDRTSHGDGWGLGLAIVRAVAVAHGGAVVARARQGGGLEIEVTFPPVASTRH